MRPVRPRQIAYATAKSAHGQTEENHGHADTDVRLDSSAEDFRASASCPAERPEACSHRHSVDTMSDPSPRQCEARPVRSPRAQQPSCDTVWGFGRPLPFGVKMPEPSDTPDSPVEPSESEDSTESPAEAPV